MTPEPEPQRSPANPKQSRDHFRWDDKSHQPHADLSPWQKLWASRAEALAFLPIVGHGARQLVPAVRRYRSLLRQTPQPRRLAAEEFGLTISPTRPTWPRYLARVEELGVRSLLVRIPVWEPEPVLELAGEFAALRERGARFTFALLQDRAAVTDPARWADFVLRTAERLAGLQPTFQVGHACNRKKWGIWLPHEYRLLLEGAAPARARVPGCRWIGPAVIDFEYYFTNEILLSERPFDFDGVSALLYVDRRGSPDAKQYRHFDLRRKILLLQALVEASPHPVVPLHLTEFNWPLRGLGGYNPASERVATDEAGQARYLVLYYLTAAATGLVADSFWWQLVARGFGLLDDDDAWSERRSYHALRTLLAKAPGRMITALPDALRPLRGFLLDGEDGVTALLWTTGTPLPLTGMPAITQMCDVAGDPARVAGTLLTPDPVYVRFASASPEEIRAALIATH
jgi:hypothetical protein